MAMVGVRMNRDRIESHWKQTKGRARAADGRRLPRPREPAGAAEHEREKRPSRAAAGNDSEHDADSRVPELP